MCVYVNIYEMTANSLSVYRSSEHLLNAFSFVKTFDPEVVPNREEVYGYCLLELIKKNIGKLFDVNNKILILAFPRYRINRFEQYRASLNLTRSISK